MANKKPTETQGAIAEHYECILELLGEDIEREGLQETPARYARYITSLVKKPAIDFKTFNAEESSDLQLTGNMPFFSACEHHTLPFFGHGLVAYIPNKRIAGLSKFARVLEHFATGFQNQERITQQVGRYLVKQLEPKGLAVILTASHTCMTTRGVKAHGSYTVTSYMHGVFKSDPSAKLELLELAKHRPS